MLNPHEITADLPSPRDDEPENLRGDIRDELADHLHCAMRRELLSGAHGNSENAAWQNVLKRFGNPTRIALECWLIKMKGKLIMQKISLGISTVALLLCIVLIGLVYKTMEASHETNTAMLDRMDKLITASLNRPQQATISTETSSKFSEEWIPVKIRFLDAPKNGKSVKGIHVTCTGPFVVAGQEESLDQTTDENGIVDFGRARPGYYKVNASYDRNDTNLSMADRICVKPDSKEYSFTIPIDPLQVNVSINIPQDLQDKHLGFDIRNIYAVPSQTNENSDDRN